MSAKMTFTKYSVWSLLDLLALYRVSWSPIARVDDRTRQPMRLLIKTVGVRILAECDQDRSSLTFYQGNEDVFDDPTTLLTHMRAAGSAATEAPRSILNLVPTMRSLGDAHRLLDQNRDETVMLTFITPTTLVELDFFDDHIEYSVFEKQATPASWEDLVAELEKFTRE